MTSGGESLNLPKLDNHVLGARDRREAAFYV